MEKELVIPAAATPLEYFAHDERYSPKSWRAIQFVVSIPLAIVPFVRLDWNGTPVRMFAQSIRRVMTDGPSGTDLDALTILPFIFAAFIFPWRLRLLISPAATRLERVAMSCLGLLSVIGCLALIAIVAKIMQARTMTIRPDAIRALAIYAIVLGLGVAYIVGLRFLKVDMRFPSVALLQAAFLATTSLFYAVDLRSSPSASPALIVAVIAASAILLEHGILLIFRGDRTL